MIWTEIPSDSILHLFIMLNAMISTNTDVFVKTKVSETNFLLPSGTNNIRNIKIAKVLYLISHFSNNQGNTSGHYLYPKNYPLVEQELSSKKGHGKNFHI